MSSQVSINLAAEGLIDISVARRLVIHAGGLPGLERPAYGKHKLDPVIPKYRTASTVGTPWLVLRDLDHDAPCAGELINRFGDLVVPNFCLRIAVREIESWLIADAVGLASLLQVPVARVERTPEALFNPKRHVIDLARSSRSRSVRDALVPDDRMGQQQGPEYAARLAEFASSDWSIDRAIQNGAAQSLVKAAARLRLLVHRLGTG
jgi:hypothetical protein